MATIEERAKVVFPNSTYSSSKLRRAYAIGATEQKAIDIEKACEWIKKNFEYYVDVEVSSYYTYDDKFVDDFRTFMEESHK